MGIYLVCAASIPAEDEKIVDVFHVFETFEDAKNFLVKHLNEFKREEYIDEDYYVPPIHKAYGFATVEKAVEALSYWDDCDIRDCFDTYFYSNYNGELVYQGKH